MDNFCDGKGRCFHVQADGKYIQQKCVKEPICSLKYCPKCGLTGPEWYFDCNYGFCSTCATSLYFVYSCSETYEKFMKKMIKLYQNDNR